MKTVRIDPKLIPDYVWDEGCRVLYECITRALSDPQRRKDYERFRAEYLAEKQKSSNPDEAEGGTEDA